MNEVIREMDQSQPKTLDIRDILDSMPDRNQEGVIVRKFDKMPLVFVEGHNEELRKLLLVRVNPARTKGFLLVRARTTCFLNSCLRDI